MTRTEAAALAAELELDVDDIAICHACLSFVSLAIDSGDERKVAGSITSMAPDLWAEGLAQPVRLALERARKLGVANAEEAIVTVDKSGPRSPVVRSSAGWPPTSRLGRKATSSAWAGSRGHHAVWVYDTVLTRPRASSSGAGSAAGV